MNCRWLINKIMRNTFFARTSWVLWLNQDLPCATLQPKAQSDKEADMFIPRARPQSFIMCPSAMAAKWRQRNLHMAAALLNETTLSWQIVALVSRGKKFHASRSSPNRERILSKYIFSISHMWNDKRNSFGGNGQLCGVSKLFHSPPSQLGVRMPLPMLSLPISSPMPSQHEPWCFNDQFGAPIRRFKDNLVLMWPIEK